MKYRLRNGEIDAARGSFCYHMATSGTVLTATTFEELFEPVPEVEPAPPPPPEPESGWKPYVIAMMAKKDDMNCLEANYCLARSHDEAVGIAWKRCNEKWPSDECLDQHIHVIRHPAPEDK